MKLIIKYLQCTMIKESNTFHTADGEMQSDGETENVSRIQRCTVSNTGVNVTTPFDPSALVPGIASLSGASGSVHVPPFTPSSRVPPSIPELPPSSVMAQAHFTWGPSEVSSEQFVQTVNAAYSEIVHWRRNVFSVPSGKAGKAFVSELARLFRSYADGSAFESIALTAAMILSQLLLQKPSTKSKAHEHLKCLAWHLEIWKAGDILSLLEEGRAIQSRLLVAKPKPSTSNQERTARAFAKLMFQGKVKAAFRLLTEQSIGGILQLDRAVSQGVQTMPHLLFMMCCYQGIHQVSLSRLVQYHNRTTHCSSCCF